MSPRATPPPGVLATAEAFHLAFLPLTLEDVADQVDADSWAIALEVGDAEVS